MTLKYSFQLICFQWLIEPLVATPSFATPGCKNTCGNITIPYPFGIGAGCFLDEWYEVLCLDERPYLSQYYRQESKGEVLNLSLEMSTITINANNWETLCDGKNISLGAYSPGSPFFYHRDNKIVVVGCGNVLLFQYGSEYLQGGCTSTCDNKYGKIQGCYGIGCCEISGAFDVSPPFRLQRDDLNFSNSMTTRNSCASFIMAEESWYSGNSISSSDPSENLVGISVPIVLMWTIPESMVPEFQNIKSICRPETGNYYRCYCPDCTEGNPYIKNGCQGYTNGTSCASTSNLRQTLVLLLLGGAGLGFFSLGPTSAFLYKTIRKRRERKIQANYFKRNGVLLLQQQQLAGDGNTINEVRHFTLDELGKATENFNENRVLGHGGQGTVYKGMLVDGQIVAIKKSKLANKNQVAQFINEVVVLSQINHRNVVKLLGCCLETDVPLLVYEFIPNGTLYNLIHHKSDDVPIPMSWDMRIRITTEVAGALACLHSATSTPIYHRDIKSSNILLDARWKAKVADFGISRHIAIDNTHLTTMVKGTFGYLDPEYFRSSQFTEKSDVYSFGVVLVELLTRQKPISPDHAEEESCLGLATRFLTLMEKDQLNLILDSQVLDTASTQQVTTVARLAQRCLSLNGRKRPTMKEVATELESIKISHMPSTSQSKFHEENSTRVQQSVITSDGIFSWTGNDIVTPSSGAYPILPGTF